MITEFPVNYHIHDFPVLGYSLGNIYTALARNISGSSEEAVLPAVANPSYDQSHFAPYFDGETWRVWDDGGYKPVATVVNNVQLVAAPSANRTQQLQAKDGVIALLDDVYGVRSTITLQEGLVSVDWDIGSKFQVILSGNRATTLYMQHSRPGRTIDILITNSGTNQVVADWDSNILWQGGTPPSMPAAEAGAAKSLIVTIRNINGLMYGEYLNAAHNPIPHHQVKLSIPSILSGGNQAQT